jgi:hypothetical protein
MPKFPLDLPRAQKAERDENLMLLWTLLRSRMRVTEHEVHLALSDAQKLQFETKVCRVLTDAKPVSGNALREYMRLVKIGDDLFKKVHSKRAIRKRSPAWHALRAKMGDCYSQAAAELARVISHHPAVAPLLSPPPQLARLASANRLVLSAGDMPRLKRNQPEPPPRSDHWQEAALAFVQDLVRKRYPKAVSFQDDGVQGIGPTT